MGDKVLVAMSGGVDSSVVAALLKEEGYEPVGITMRLWNLPADEKKRGCCSLDDVNDAERVAESLGIPHYTLNLKEAFRENVVDYMVREYQRGRTPNPCIACNRVLKFQLLMDRARKMGIEQVATGHYARIEKRDLSYVIRRGVDPAKDQSYFLFDTPQVNLRRILFPLGNYTKDETREAARRFGLNIAEKDESQEICFVPGDDYRKFLTDMGVAPQAGDFITGDGKKVGRHAGISFYTIGQRRGLGLSAGSRLYVTEIRPETNTIVVGPREELLSGSMIVANSTFHIPVMNGDELLVQVRYRHTPVKATLYLLDDGSVQVEFAEPEEAVAPGQAAVFYIGDAVAGGGWIESFTPAR